MRRGCVAQTEQGRRCGAPGILVDVERGGMVCAAHAPQTPLLRYSIRRAMGYPATFLAAALAEQTDEALAAALGCPAGVIWRLRLARHPSGSDWEADVARLALALDCEPARLAALLRRLPAPSG